MADSAQAALGKALPGLYRKIIGEAAPQKRVCALPWRPLPNDGQARTDHTLSERWAVSALAQAALETYGPTRIVPLHLAWQHLRHVTTSHGDATRPLLDAMVREIAAGHNGTAPQRCATALRPALQAHLRSDKVLLIISGLADVDAQGEFCGETVSVESILKVIDACGARRICIFARGSGTGDACHVAHHRAFHDGGYTIDWLIKPGTPTDPSDEHQRALLASRERGAFKEVLQLRTFAEARDGEESAAALLAHSRAFLLPPAELSPAGAPPPQRPPRLGRTLQPVDLALRPLGDRDEEHAGVWDEAKLGEYIDQPSSQGLLLLDGVGWSGGWGKTTLLLGLLAQAQQLGRAAIYLSLAALDDYQSDLLVLALRQLGQRAGTDPALLAQMQSQGLMLLVDGLNEVRSPASFSQRIGDLVRGLAGDLPRTQVIVASRADTWLQKRRAGEPLEDLPAPTQLRLALANDTRPAPHIARLLPLAEAEVRRAIDDVRHELLGAVGPHQAPLLTHPPVFGLLALQRQRALPGLTDLSAALRERQRSSGRELRPDDVVEIVVAQLLAFGLHPDSRAKRSSYGQPPLGEGGGALARAQALLDHLALATAEQGTPLEVERSREVLLELAATDIEGNIAAEASAIMERLRRRYPWDEEQLAILAEVFAQATRERHVATRADAADDELRDLCAVSLILERAQQGYWLPQQSLRRILARRALRRLAALRPQQARLSRWLLGLRRHDDILAEGGARIDPSPATPPASSPAAEADSSTADDNVDPALLELAAINPVAFVKGIAALQASAEHDVPELAEDDEPKVAKIAAATLTRALPGLLVLAALDTFRALARLLNDPVARGPAAWVLTRLAPRLDDQDAMTACTLLFNRLRADVATRRAALEVLISLAVRVERDIVQRRLTRLLSSGNDIDTRLAALAVLAVAAPERARPKRRRTPDALGALLDPRLEPDPAVRVAALRVVARALQSARPDEIARPVTQLIASRADPDNSVRIEATAGIELAATTLLARELPSEARRFLDPVRALFGDREFRVREGAARVVAARAPALPRSELWQILGEAMPLVTKVSSGESLAMEVCP